MNDNPEALYRSTFHAGVLKGMTLAVGKLRNLRDGDLTSAFARLTITEAILSITNITDSEIETFIDQRITELKNKGLL